MAGTSTWEDVPTPKTGGWEDVPIRPSWSQAIGNIPSDVVQTVKEIASVPGAIGQAIQHPGDTLSNIGSAVGHGVVNQGRQIAGALTGGTIGETQDEALARIEADRARAIQRPLTTVANIALSGLPSGELTAGQGILKGITAGTREAANIPTFLAAGVGRNSSNAMLEAAAKGGPEAAAARAGMISGDPMPVAKQALDAADQLAIDKNARYMADAQQWKIPGQIADVAPIRQAVTTAEAANTMPLTGVPRNAATKDALAQLQAIIDTHTTIPAANTPSGIGNVRLNRLSMDEVDALKKELGTVIHGKEIPPVVKQNTRDIYDAAKQSAVNANPVYAGAMERSQADIENLRNIRQELSLKPNASKATILGKLQSAMRNDVSSRFGARGQMLDQLATKDPTLPAALAGQDFSAWYPRGLSKLIPGMEGVAAGHALLTGAASVNPLTVALAPIALAASSPRIQGEARYLAGLLTRGARNVGATQKNLGRGIEASRLAGLLMNQQGAQ